MKDINNKLLKRREVNLVVESELNPGFAQAAVLVGKECKASEDLVVVKAVRGSFGSHEFLIEAFIYNSVDDKARVEPKLEEKKKEGAV